MQNNMFAGGSAFDALNFETDADENKLPAQLKERIKAFNDKYNGIPVEDLCNNATAISDYGAIMQDFLNEAIKQSFACAR